MKVVVAAFNQEKALEGVFSVITNLRMELFEAIVWKGSHGPGQPLVTKFDNLQFPLVAVLGAVATLPPCNDGHQFREFGLKEESSLDHSLGECWAESVH